MAAGGFPAGVACWHRSGRAHHQPSNCRPIVEPWLPPAKMPFAAVEATAVFVELLAASAAASFQRA
jgi:hypothetical protein